MNTDKIIQFQGQILLFWEQQGRNYLPWRQTTDPWKILIAEILLRKTTSSQVSRVYSKLENLTPKDIVSLDSSQLEYILMPLGMNRVRAEQLKVIAATTVNASFEDYQSDEFLRSMPGIGRYISNSVRCCAFGIPAPALDANMIRIIQRVFDWQPTRKRAREDKALWDFAESLVPCERCKEYNWGVLDFGSAICIARKPKCSLCSIQQICYFHQE